METKKELDVVMATPEEVLEKKEREIVALRRELANEKSLRLYAEDSLRLYDGNFDFSQLWLDQEPSKLNLTGIISIVLMVIVMIVVLLK